MWRLCFSGGSSGTAGLDCVLEDDSNTILFSVAWCVSRDCVSSGGCSGTGGLGCVLEDVSNTILFSVF